MSFRVRVTRFAPLAFVLMGSAAFAVTPTVTLSPTGNHPKGTTQVSGTGFGINEAVDIYFDTTDQMLVVTNASGKFGADTLTIPATALPGSHWITAVERNNGVAAQHTFLVRTRWAEHGFNERGQRRNPYENVIDVGNVGNLDTAWTATTGGSIFSSPAVANVTSSYDPYVFVGSQDGNLYAYDSGGMLKWQKALGGGIFSSPAVASNTVYVGSADDKLHALNATTGASVWTSPATGAQIFTSPAVANGIVYVGSNDDHLYAFNASTGAPVWTSAAMGSYPDASSPAVANGVVYIGCQDHKLYAFNALTGASAWATPLVTGNPVESSPVVAGGMVFFGSEDNNVYAVNAKSGSVVWAVATTATVTSGAAVANGTVYVPSGDGKLYALRTNNGAIQWTGMMVGASFSTPAVANGVVYVGDGNGMVYAFDANGCGSATCSPLWTALTNSVVQSSPAISDGMLYVGSNDDNLYAYALDAGNNAAYRFRKSTPPPSYTTLHPDLRLKPVRH